jgi:glucuronate isomerase
VPEVLHPDRLLPAEPAERALARQLYDGVADLPLFCPHTHVDPWVLAEDRPFTDPAALFVTSDHYVVRTLMSQGIPPSDLGIRPKSGGALPATAREVWRTLARNWHLFRGTPTQLWVEYQLAEVFGIGERLGAASADATFDRLSELLGTPEFRPRALYSRFGIDLLATTDAPHLPLTAHEQLHAGGWGHRVVPTFRPDQLVELDGAGWATAVQQLAAVTDIDTSSFDGFLEALRQRRRDFAALGATATDHGPAQPYARRSSPEQIRAVYDRALSGRLDAGDADRFRAHMLMEFAGMSSEDGLVMQLHTGSTRNHDRQLFRAYGPDMGADIPHAVDFVNGLAELLNAYGNAPGFTLIVFTLDETTLARELAPLAAHYPGLRIGPPWWFYDSPDGMRRHRELLSETAGFYNGAGFNDDARNFTSIPARHDMARRVDSAYLARLVAEHRLDLDAAHEVARLWAHDQAREVYRAAAR